MMLIRPLADQASNEKSAVTSSPLQPPSTIYGESIFLHN